MTNENTDQLKEFTRLTLLNKTLSKSSRRVENLRNQQLSANKENISSDKNISLKKYPKNIRSTRVEFIHYHL